MLTNIRNTRIEWGDCDPAGIVFYPRYFEMFDASTTMLIERALGMSKFEYLKAYDSSAIRWSRPARRFRMPTRFGDEVAIETALVALRPVELQDRASSHQGGRARGRRFGDAGVGGPPSGRSGAHEVRSRSPPRSSRA